MVGLNVGQAQVGKVLPGVIPGVSSIPTDRRSCNSPACQIPADFDASDPCDAITTEAVKYT